jgi:tetratricopeptide (TPR) repeat protein
MPVSIALNMIVKNEGKIIERVLTSVLPWIDSYCICDTGSTDNTVEIIESFFASHYSEKPIRGKIIVEPFRDFGYNRSHALKQCVDLPNADYILLIDADMIFTYDANINIQEFKDSLVDYDAYYVFQGSDTFFYKNVRFLKNSPENSYWGVTHEYVKTPANTKYHLLPRSLIFIADIGDGGSKNEKFARDVVLLKRGLEEYPNNDRYTFYLANSYRDLGDNQNAIETYKKRIKIGGWKEEIWYSYYSIGKCYKSMNDDANAIFYWLEGYNFLPERAETVYEILRFYRETGKYILAYSFYKLADSIRRRLIRGDDHLFLQKDVYDFKIDYELSIIGYYHNPEKIDMSKVSMIILANRGMDDSIMQNIVSNYKFYTPKLSDLVDDQPTIGFHAAAMPQLTDGETSEYGRDMSGFLASTPSICAYTYKTHDFADKTKLAIMRRFVNYRIDDNGGYICGDKITTVNVLSVYDVSGNEFNKKIETILKYDKTLDNYYVGLEDVRVMFYDETTLIYNANRGLSRTNIAIEHGQIDIETGQTFMSNIVSYVNQRPVEKNWVIFSTKLGQVKCIYGWFPLTIGEFDSENCLHVTETHTTPELFKMVRGSTNGVFIENEIWFICHLVSNENRRYYYHLFVVLDAETHEIKKYSKLFTFECSKVEYTLGFVYLENRFIVGYSVMDRETKYMSLSEKSVADLFWRDDEPTTIAV